jgi:superfamily II DNA helicase RecQ
MKLQFFTIPVSDPTAAMDELNAFLAVHRVVTVERQFVADGANSLWSVCVSYVEGEGRPSPEKRQKRVDYREMLPAEEFAVFSKLRQLRKELAEQEGIPVYAVFTNDHLAAMVRQRVMSLAGLNRIDGVGKARLEKYGDAFLHLLKRDIPALSPEPSATEEPHEANGHLS